MTTDRNDSPTVLDALTDPASVFGDPSALLADDGFTGEQKVAILRRWRHDCVEEAVATEENMGGDSGEGPMLDRVNDALHSLGASQDGEDAQTFKHGL